jgi:CheY-like chemotaxis protein
MLASIGLNCITATEADPVIDIIAAEKIDLVLMDLNMPITDGYDLSKKIRMAGFTIPIIAHTAVAKENIDMEDLMDAEMQGYLIKPYPIEDLEDMLTQHLDITFS